MDKKSSSITSFELECNNMTDDSQEIHIRCFENEEYAKAEKKK